MTIKKSVKNIILLVVSFLSITAIANAAGPWMVGNNWISIVQNGSNYYVGIASTTPTKDLSVGNYFGVDAGTGNVVSGNLVPATATSTLGTATNPWKDLFVSSSTIYVGNLRLQDVNGSLSITNKNNPTTTLVGITAGTSTIVSTSTGQIASPSQWTSTSTDIYYTTGKVGIGTTTPGFPLDIRNATNGATALVRIDDGSSSGLWSGFRIDRGAAEKWFIGMTASSTDLVFRRSGSTNDIFISSSTGNVGIGTSTPRAKLSIAGEIQIASTTLACDSTTEGSLRYNFGGKALEFCNGSQWGGVAPSTLGLLSSTPGTSCYSIKSANASATDGTYWIAPGGVAAFQAYCDMTTDGGGWTLVLSGYGNDNPGGWTSTTAGIRPTSPSITATYRASDATINLIKSVSTIARATTVGGPATRFFYTAPLSAWNITADSGVVRYCGNVGMSTSCVDQTWSDGNRGMWYMMSNDGQCAAMSFDCTMGGTWYVNAQVTPTAGLALYLWLR